MNFEWDENKRRAVLEARGVDILYAARIFRGEIVTFPDDRRDYGELRLISIGMVERDCFVVVHTPRGESTRIVTAWKGGRDEQTQYKASISGRD